MRKKEENEGREIFDATDEFVFVSKNGSFYVKDKCEKEGRQQFTL